MKRKCISEQSLVNTIRDKDIDGAVQSNRRFQGRSWVREWGKCCWRPGWHRPRSGKIILHHHHHLTNMQLGHLLTRSSLTRLQVSVMVSPRSFCLLVCRFSLSSVNFYGTFCLYVYILQPDSVYILLPNSVYMLQPNFNYILRPNSVYMLRPNFLYILRPNSVYMLRPNSVYMLRPNSVYMLRRNSVY
jgi:hypothetical protein